MSPKQIILIGMFIGSAVGGLIPSLWGAGGFSFSSMTFSAAGAIAGIYICFKLTR